MNNTFKQRMKEKLGIMVGVATLVFSIIGIFSLSEYISIYGSIITCFVIFGMYKYV